MTEKNSKIAFVGDRFISFSPAAILQVVAVQDGDPVLINLDEAPDTDAEFDAIGMVMDDGMIVANGFKKVFEVDPKVGDTVAARRSTNGEFVVGQVVAESTHLVTIETGPRVSDTILANKKLVCVLAPLPREGQTFSLDEIVQVLDPFNGRYSHIGGVVSTTASNDGKVLPKGHVLVEFRDGYSASIPIFALAPYNLDYSITVLGKTDVITNGFAEAFPDIGDTFAGRPINSFYGAEFIPANVTIGADRADPKNAIGEIFSLEEFALLDQTGMTDDDSMANLVGCVINAGRTVPVATLRTLLDLTIPYGFSIYIDNPIDFFDQVGKVATAQAVRNLEALARGEAPQDFAVPTEVVFSRIVGYTPDELKTTGRPGGTENAPGANAGSSFTPPPVPEKADEVTKVLLAALDEQFGAGNYRLLTAEEAVETFGVSALEAIQEGGIFGVFEPQGDGVSASDAADIDQAIVEDGNDEEAFNDFLDALMAGMSIGSPLPPKRNTVADAIKSLQEVDPNVNIDECLTEFDTLAKAGFNDSNILARQIDEGTSQIKIITTMLAEDADKLIAAANGIKAGLKLLEENSQNIDLLQGNARMVGDAFDALSADVNNLQRLRENL